MDYEKKIPFVTFDSELVRQEINIPEDFEAVIDGNKIILMKSESKDEKIRKWLLDLVQGLPDNGLIFSSYDIEKAKVIAWLKKQKPIQNINKEDEEVRQYIIRIMKQRDINVPMVQKALTWLEKQDTERKQLYVRFGDIPSNEKSKIYHGEEEIGDENGVSVYPAFELNGNIVLGLTLPITKTTLYTQQHLLEYDNRPCYLVGGDYVGKGTDGEPLIKNIYVIKRLDNYRIKECKKKPAIEMITPEESLGIDSETYNDIVNTCIFGENKPKFKVGDWIVDNCGYVWKIKEILNQFYILEDTEGDESHPTIEWVNKTFHLLTIQDVRNGDMLAADRWSDYPSSFVAIYKKQNGEDFDSYCFVGFDGKFYKGENGHSTEEIHPATKEQRDLLFQKMYEAGYKWDGEKKELKKIEQKSATMFLDEAIEHCKEKSCGNNACALEHKQLEKWLTELKELKEQKPAWSEEDEKILKDILVDVKFEGYNNDMLANSYKKINWLKSLKEKFKIQTRQGISKEDEYSFMLISGLIRQDQDLSPENKNKLRLWLKSIIYQSRWKPSDEQMEALWNTLHPDDPYYVDLSSLYNDLKKLKGE